MKKLIIGKRYYFDRTKQASGRLSQNSEGQLLFTDIKNNTEYVELNKTVSFDTTIMGESYATESNFPPFK